MPSGGGRAGGVGNQPLLACLLGCKRRTQPCTCGMGRAGQSGARVARTGPSWSAPRVLFDDLHFLRYTVFSMKSWTAWRSPRSCLPFLCPPTTPHLSPPAPVHPLLDCHTPLQVQGVPQVLSFQELQRCPGWWRLRRQQAGRPAAARRPAAISNMHSEEKKALPHTRAAFRPSSTHMAGGY